MAQGGNDVMGGSAGMSPRKAMASGMGPGATNFGVASFDKGMSKATNHPDKVAKTGAKGAMNDSSRGIGMPVAHTKGQHPGQASPDHGPTHPGGHGAKHYGAKV